MVKIQKKNYKEERIELYEQYKSLSFYETILTNCLVFIHNILSSSSYIKQDKTERVQQLKKSLGSKKKILNSLLFPTQSTSLIVCHSNDISISLALEIFKYYNIKFYLSLFLFNFCPYGNKLM